MEAGRFSLEHRARLYAFRTVIRGTPRSLTSSVLLPEHELKLARRLAGTDEPDLGMRLLVATSGAVFRVWRESLDSEAWPDPLAALGDLLDRVSV